MQTSLHAPYKMTNPAGTHAIAAALFACCRSGDEILVATGDPYDTLEEVLGTRGESRAGSLRDYGVATRMLPLRADGTVDVDGLERAIEPGVRVSAFGNMPATSSRLQHEHALHQRRDCVPWHVVEPDAIGVAACALLYGLPCAAA